MKTTKCIVCEQEGKKMRGRYCHSCDYVRNKQWFKERSIRRKEEGYYVDSSKYKYYTKARAHYGNKCMDCGWDTHPEVLQVHHVDENRKNNKLNNLMVLCPTCHNVRHFLNKTGIFTPKS